MPYVLGILEVEDLAKWKTAYDSEDGAAMRKAVGMKSYQIFRREDDPNKVIHLSQWDNMDDARKFLQSEELEKANQESGVIEMGGVYFLEEVESKSV
jgi:heme-degrading monooxygenase HmoA